MAETLAQSIQESGMNQGDLVKFLKNVRDVVNELIDDHGTYRTSVGQIETLIEELHDDHATFKTAVDQTETLVEELHDDHATFKTIVDELKTDYTALLADVTEIRTKLIATHAKLDADAGVTDTNYAATNNPAALTATAIAASSPATLTAAKPASAPATLTAPKPASPPAALTNSTALTLNRG